MNDFLHSLTQSTDPPGSADSSWENDMENKEHQYNSKIYYNCLYICMFMYVSM